MQTPKSFFKGKSYLSLSEIEAQEIVNKFAGTGEIKRDSKGRWNNKEVITADKNIGHCVDVRTGAEVVTNRATIHYSKKGVHIVPAPRKEE